MGHPLFLLFWCFTWLIILFFGVQYCWHLLLFPKVNYRNEKEHLVNQKRNHERKTNTWGTILLLTVFSQMRANLFKDCHFCETITISLTAKILQFARIWYIKVIYSQAIKKAFEKKAFHLFINTVCTRLLVLAIKFLAVLKGIILNYGSFKGNPNSQGILNWIAQILHY